jgi:hypothetical protein
MSAHPVSLVLAQLSEKPSHKLRLGLQLVNKCFMPQVRHSFLKVPEG